MCSMTNMLSVAADGVTHINVYSYGQTKLGRLLSNLAHTPFSHSCGTLGKSYHFECAEQYWYIRKLHEHLTEKQIHEILNIKDVDFGLGFKVKRHCTRLQRQFPLVEIDDSFKADFCLALKSKLRQNREILKLLYKSSPDIPFEHYYVRDGKVVDQSLHSWQFATFVEVRTALQNPDCML